MAEITKRSEDYSRWYLDVIREAELADNSPVRGCMVIRPNGYAIWENVQSILDARFKELGHVNAYFPLLIPKSFLAKEAEHVEGFAKECAIVTHHRLKQVTENGKVTVVPDPESKLEEEYVIRPTSETVIWDMYRKWIQSYRDLPILINQWANVVRWELRTRMFLRTTEFLWQEGHTAHATAQEGRAETLQMLEVYRWFAEDILALPVVPGVKTASERFAGAVETFSIEAMMQDNKALQAATSHDLGQNFARAFDVKFQDQDGKVNLVWATSWGMSTRIIGALVMAHSDDDGLVLPPRIAGTKAVIVPIWKNDDEKAATCAAAHRIAADLRKSVGPVVVDDRDNLRPGTKYGEWERKGVPLRLEIGPRDLDQQTVMLKARHDRAKTIAPMTDIVTAVVTELDRIQADLYARALARRAAATHVIDTWADFEALYAGEGGFAESHWCGDAACEKAIQEKLAVTIRNLPFGRDETPGACVHCGKPSLGRVVFAQSY
jgi:prolyl-tRNA synthetase